MGYSSYICLNCHCTDIDSMYEECPCCARRHHLGNVVPMEEFNEMEALRKKEEAKKLAQEKATARRFKEKKKKKREENKQRKLEEKKRKLEEEKNKANANLNFKDWKNAVCSSGEISRTAAKWFRSKQFNKETMSFMYESYMFGNDNIDSCAKEVFIRYDQWSIDNHKHNSSLRSHL